MNEADVKRAMVKRMFAEKGYARRIEDQFSVGFPDLITIPRNGPTLFLEIKIIRGLSFGVTERQLIEIQRINDARRELCAFMVGYKDGTFYYSPAAKSVKIQDCYRQQDCLNLSQNLRYFVEHYLDKGQ